MSELCDIGQELWENFRCRIYEKSRYDKYVEHIVSCIECRTKLELKDDDVEIIKNG